MAERKAVRRSSSSSREGYPSPDERAELVVTKLERFIRENRTVSQGVSFRKWQELAKAEIVDMFRDIETSHARESRTLERTLMVLGAGLATIGVWGTALAVGAAPHRVLAAMAVLGGGLVVLWCVGALGMQAPIRRFRASQRQAGFQRVRSLNRKVSDLEHELKRRRKAMQAKVDVTPDV
jgi:hypothetical protein